MLVVNRPSAAYQYACCFARPSGRIAPRSLRDTDRARDRGSLTRIQSISVPPRNRNGEAGAPPPPMTGAWGSSTPRLFETMPVLRGNRPDVPVACPGAVSVIA